MLRSLVQGTWVREYQVPARWNFYGNFQLYFYSNQSMKDEVQTGGMSEKTNEYVMLLRKTK
jgi:hypothetical protein